MVITINGKQLVEVHDKDITQAEEINHSLANQANDNTNQAHSLVEQWQRKQNQQTKATNVNHNLNREHHANNNQSGTSGTSATSGSSQNQKASTSKSNYLF